jgi:hypothetical protein
VRYRLILNPEKVTNVFMETMIIPVEIPETPANRIVFNLFETGFRKAGIMMNKGSKEAEIR